MGEHFNYVSYGAEGYLAKDIFDLSMSRGRRAVCAPVDMEKRLENLNTNSLAFMQQLPTFVCSEIGRAGKNALMRIRFGSIEDVVVDRKEVSATFSPIIEFGEVHSGRGGRGGLVRRGWVPTLPHALGGYGRRCWWNS